ncbi:unnamed protein product [Thelazia callipaeda]|uniref:RNA polymerase II subunit A C-terminal domain phosphatase n=1 Tax=Thelazia callipaeda TaxID=103827 RepID=A0A0N5D776_THECL|nr:unnamed protein product [Thelazia callipaeda]
MGSRADLLFEDDEGELINWKITDGAFVTVDSVLFVYSVKSGEKKPLKTSLSGVVTIDTTITEGKILKKGMVVASIRPCKHAIVIKDMCASCGKDLRGRPGFSGDVSEVSTANVSMIHHVPELIVSDELAWKIGSRDRELLLKARKLVLLVDLDQTLIHTTNHACKPKNEMDILHYKLKGIDFYTKVRPYTRDFLENMAELYEMHIISYGERQYAHRIAEILDPDKKYFGHRILSRDELFCAMYKTKNMQALFPCGDHMIVMIDDRPDVWQYSDALVQVKPYRFFKEVGDINNSRYPENEVSAPTIHAEQDSDSEVDETLEYVAAVLTKLHSAFYELFDDAKIDRFPVCLLSIALFYCHFKDLKGIISYLRKQVLKNCSIVISGIVPVGVDVKKTEVYRLCVQFGASVTNNLCESTTHLIAARLGTAKVYEAQKRKNIFIVNIKWLFTCVERWEKVDEKDFELLSFETPSAEKLQRNVIITNELSRLPTFGKKTLSQMTGEVDEALSEEELDNNKEGTEIKSSDILFSIEGKKRRSENTETENSASSSKKLAVEDLGDNGSETSSLSVKSETDDDVDDMAAAVEEQFFAM